MSPHVRYDILLANLYFKNIHQSEDFQEGRGMNLESVVELAELGGVWGVGGQRRGRKEGWGSPSIFPFKPWLARQLRPSRGGRGGGDQHLLQLLIDIEACRGNPEAPREKCLCCFEASRPEASSSRNGEWSSQAPPECRQSAATQNGRPAPTKAPPPEVNLILSRQQWSPWSATGTDVEYHFIVRRTERR